MINIDDLRNNIEYYQSRLKDQRFKEYYTILSEYEYDKDFDFTSFITFMENNDNRKQCNRKLRKIRKRSITEKRLKEKRNKKFQEKYDYDYDYADALFKHLKSGGEIEAIQKNKNLVKQLEDIRTNALGIGTNKIKRRLNKLSKENGIAKALRKAIEIEDVNIQAKKAYGKYRDKQYNKKSELIIDLIEIFKENNWTYGIHKEPTHLTNVIVFFEIPNTEQISFHNYMKDIDDLPIYDKKWDGKENSTYPKLLDSIEKQFSEIIY